MYENLFTQPFAETFRLYGIRLQCTTLTLLEAGPFWGSMLHGVLGRQLMDRFCTTRHFRCAQCDRRASCQYLRIFKPSPPAAHQHSAKYSELPQPVIIRKEMYGPSLFPPGSAFFFDLSLVGDAIFHLPHITQAFGDAGKEGIGRMAGKFEIVEVSYFSSELNNYTTLATGQLPQPLKPEAFFDTINNPPDQIQIEFVTPVIIRDKKKEVSNITPSLFIQRLYERFMLLNHFQCGGIFPEIEQLQVQNIDCSTSFAKYHFARFSNRTEKKIPLNGLLGKMVMTGETKPFLPLLRLGAWINVGKMASMGLGHYVLNHV